MNAGNLDEAYSIFIALGDYKDATVKANSIRLANTKEQLKTIKVGNYIKFGAYEQDNNTSNGKEAVEWLVLEVKDGKALVISKYALDYQRYHSSFVAITWEDCTLREWLNIEFINSAFSDEEQKMIPTVTVSADRNPEYKVSPGNATKDKVFLLSITEVNKYFVSNSARQCKQTVYAKAQRTYTIEDNGYIKWWLRSPGDDQVCDAFVDLNGSVNVFGLENHASLAVRPAMWIDLSN